MNDKRLIPKNNLNKKKIRLINIIIIKEKIQKKKLKFFWKLIIILLLYLINSYCLFFIKNYKLREISSRNEFIFILCMFGKDILKSNDRMRKYFFTLNKFLPQSTIVLAISEFTLIEPNLIKFKNININIERYGNETIQDIIKKYKGDCHFYYNGIRFSFYKNYLKNHPEIKYVVLSDDDTLFFRDPFILLDEDPNVVHMMEDIYPFSKTKDCNYIWTNAWVNLNNSIKLKCGFKLFNNTLLSNEIKNLVPLNSGMMIGSSKNIIKISELISSRFICSGMFPHNAEQGLLNYLDLSGELKELGFPIHRHNIFTGSLISCPDLLPIENYTQLSGTEGTHVGGNRPAAWSGGFRGRFVGETLEGHAD